MSIFIAQFFNAAIIFNLQTYRDYHIQFANSCEATCRCGHSFGRLQRTDAPGDGRPNLGRASCERVFSSATCLPFQRSVESGWTPSPSPEIPPPMISRRYIWRYALCPYIHFMCARSHAREQEHRICLSGMSFSVIQVAALAFRLNKPLSCRLLPMKGKKAGEWTEVDSPYLCNTRVFSLNSSSSLSVS